MLRLKRWYQNASIRHDNHQLNVLALALVVTLLGSVVIPAHLTWRSVGRLDGITAVDPTVAAALEDVRVLEETSLVVNAVLVIVALAAMMSVVALTRRERHLAATVQRRLEEESALRDEAREGRRQLERAMQARSRLMRGFSHDVKNPLGAADGFAELLTLGIKGELTPEQRDTIEHIRRCIKTALTLITDLHQLGRAETGNIVLDKSSVDLTALGRAIEEDYQGAARAKGLSLAVELPVKPLLVETDAVRLREIIGNLLSNAIKYTPAGSVTLRLSIAAHAGDGPEEVRIDVSDTGPGITAEKHEFIFEEFSRLSTEETGAGLGLSISKLLAEALGGRISLVSQSGSGSTFSLWLPLERSEEITDSRLQLQTTH